MVSTAAGVTPTYMAERRSKEKKKKKESTFQMLFSFTINLWVELMYTMAAVIMPCIK